MGFFGSSNVTCFKSRVEIKMRKPFDFLNYNLIVLVLLNLLGVQNFPTKEATVNIQKQNN